MLLHEVSRESRVDVETPRNRTSQRFEISLRFELGDRFVQERDGKITDSLHDVVRQTELGVHAPAREKRDDDRDRRGDLHDARCRSILSLEFLNTQSHDYVRVDSPRSTLRTTNAKIRRTKRTFVDVDGFFRRRRTLIFVCYNTKISELFFEDDIAHHARREALWKTNSAPMCDRCLASVHKFVSEFLPKAQGYSQLSKHDYEDDEPLGNDLGDDDFFHESDDDDSDVELDFASSSMKQRQKSKA